MEMMLLRDGAIALLAAVGLTVILWGLADLIFRGRETEPAAVVLLPLHGKTMEHDVQTLLSHRRYLGSTAPVVLLDCGLSGEDRHGAELLVQRYEGLLLITAEELSNYWKQGQQAP